MAGRIDPPSGTAIAAAQATGLAEGFRLVARAPGDWWSLALEHDTTLTWPAHTNVTVRCGAGWVKAMDIYAMTPPLEQRVIRIGGAYALELDPSRLWRRRFRKGKVATVIFARFPSDSCRGEVTEVSLQTEGR